MSSPQPSSNAPRRVKIAGIVILVLGIVGGAVAHFAAQADDSPEFSAMEQQRVDNQLARIGGTAAVRTVKFDAWLASMWQGENLAWTLAVLGVLVGGACVYVGGLMAEDVGDVPRR